VEAKYPALLFKQQLDAFVQKIFPMLRDNVKKEVTPQLAACIHAPRAATTRGRRGGGGAPADLASPRAPPRGAARARAGGADAAAVGRTWCLRFMASRSYCARAWGCCRAAKCVSVLHVSRSMFGGVRDGPGSCRR
jgi:hypothetical protein